ISTSRRAFLALNSAAPRRLAVTARASRRRRVPLAADAAPGRLGKGPCAVPPGAGLPAPGRVLHRLASRACARRHRRLPSGHRRNPFLVVERGSRRIVASTSPYKVSYARLAASVFNTPKEVDTAVAAVRTL